jgi:hypothetical protein
MSSEQSVELSTTYGIFNVYYAGYYQGWKGSYMEPPEPASVEILKIEYSDDPAEYSLDGDYNDLLDDKYFREELEQLVIQYIQDKQLAEKEEHQSNNSSLFDL